MAQNTFADPSPLVYLQSSPPSHFGQEFEAHRILHQWLRELKRVTATGGLAMVALGYFAHAQADGQVWWGAAGATVALATVGMVVARTEIRSSQIHSYFGVNRPPFN
jgi:hypothetical protein